MNSERNCYVCNVPLVDWNEISEVYSFDEKRFCNEDCMKFYVVQQEPVEQQMMFLKELRRING